EEFCNSEFDVLINATAAGLSDQSPPLTVDAFAVGAFAYDMVYGRETPFLALARSCEARTCDGLGMLVEQAAESFQLWRGVRPATAAVLAALRRG
ncbi:MAG: shikimate dehydrogenase, partial [Burkholderiales bacterium]